MNHSVLYIYCLMCMLPDDDPAGIETFLILMFYCNIIVRQKLCIWFAFVILYPRSYLSCLLLAIHQISDCLCLEM